MSFSRKVPVRRWGRRPRGGTARTGSVYEACAVAWCRRQRIRVVGRHLRLGRWEVDCLGWDGRGWVVIEVRFGRRCDPVRTLSPEKRRRVLQAAEGLGRRTGKPARAVLLTVRGQVGGWERVPGFEAGLRWWPEGFGLRLRAYDLGL